MRATQEALKKEERPDRLMLICDSLPAATRVLKMSAVESLSQPYTFTLDVAMPEEEGLVFDMAEVLYSRATLTINGLNVAQQTVYHGTLIAVDWLQELADHVVYRMVMVPWLSHLGLSHHSTVYVEKTIKEIISEVLERNGFFEDQHYEFRLGTVKYEVLPHVSQYRESDLSFLHRRMEREGLYYFFEQGEQVEKLIITDIATAHAESASVSYFSHNRRQIPEVEALTSFTCRRQTRPGNVRLREFDPLLPDTDLTRVNPVSQGGRGEVVIHGENYTTEAEGRRLSRVQAEELKAREVLFEGRGQVFNLRAGYTFTVSGHPRFDGTYLATAVHHSSALGDGDIQELILAEDPGDLYEVRVEAIPASIQYRPPRITPIPRIYGTEMGVVDGQQISDFAQIDDHGRYKVRLFFNEIERHASWGSAWVRMLQPHAGKTEGFHFPLRKGTEVMLVFLGGDPDRPVIVGAIPNTNTPSPVTRHNATQNVIVTGGDNLIEMEDAKGSQYVHLSTPTEQTLLHMGAKDGSGHNVHLSSKGSALVDLGAELDIEVGGHKHEHVKLDVQETYDKTQDISVKEDRSLTVGALDATLTREQKVETQLTRSIKVGTDQTHTVSGNDELTVLGQQCIVVVGPKEESVTGTLTQKSGPQTNTVAGPRTTTVNGPETTTINGPLVQNITGGATITSPAGYHVIAPDHNVVAPSKWFKATVSSVDVVGSKMNVIGQKMDLSASAISATGFKADLTNLKVDITRVRVQNDPLSLAQANTRLASAAIGLYMYGVTIFS